MAPSLPSGPEGFRVRALVRAAGSAFLLLALAGVAEAFEVSLQRVYAEAGVLRTDLRLRDVFDERIEASLARGMPATLLIHAELWRSRTAWFDRLVSNADVSIKVRFEALRGRYRIQRSGLPDLGFDSMDSVRTMLSRAIPMPVGRMEVVKLSARHYMMISVTLQPMTVEDLREGEEWLSGEVEAGRDAGFGILASLPRSVFDALRDYAGLGDRRARVVSPDFVPESLPVDWPTESR